MGREKTAQAKPQATRPDVEPVEAPSPRGTREVLPPAVGSGVCREGGPVPGPGVKEGPQRTSKGALSHLPVCQHRVGTAPQRPQGGMGGVLSAGSRPQQMETRPRKLACHSTALGEAPLLPEGAPARVEGGVQKKRQGGGQAADRGLGSHGLQSHHPSFPCSRHPL
jgi:hypothetical protein